MKKSDRHFEVISKNEALKVMEAAASAEGLISAKPIQVLSRGAEHAARPRGDKSGFSKRQMKAME